MLGGGAELRPRPGSAIVRQTAVRPLPLPPTDRANDVELDWRGRTNRTCNWSEQIDRREENEGREEKALLRLGAITAATAVYFCLTIGTVRVLVFK